MATFTVFFDIQIPVAARNVKKILKVKCCPQVMFFSTPPQEQGRFGVNVSIYPIYNVKIAIKAKELYNPQSLVRGINNNNDIISSVMGKAQATSVALLLISGDFAKTFLKLPNSKNLLKAV